METTSDASVKKVRSRLRFSYDPPGGISWEQEEGETKSLTGSWEFQEAGEDRTRSHLRPAHGSRPHPRPAPARPVEGKVKELLTKSAAEGLRSQAERAG